MNENIAHNANPIGIERRTFLRNSLLLAVPVVLAGTGISGPALAAAYVPVSRKRGSALRNVKNYGAVGNGTRDETSSFQAAIDSLPSSGGTVFVPAGTYLIDAVRSVKLRSFMHLKLDPSAKLVAKPTSSDRYNVVLADVVQEVEISGGRIVGERDKHKSTGGEGGHGIRIRGSKYVTIRDIHISKGWGDGITVGPRPVYKKPFIYSRDVVVANIVCTGNRRNGLSIGNVIGMKVYDSEFSDTNGTSPQCGIDVEPDRGPNATDYCDEVWIENCVMRDNAAYGVNVWKRARNVTVTKCIIEKNKTCGIVTRAMVGGTFKGNTIRNNMSTGMFIQEDTSGLGISGNTFHDNYLKQGIVERNAFTLTGVSTKIVKDLIVGNDTSQIRVGANTYK